METEWRKTMAIIRKAATGDLGSIQTIASKSWNDTYRGLIPEDVQSRFLSEAYSDAMMPVRLEKTLLLVADQGEELVGFANASKKVGTAHLHAIYMLPEAKGSGIGTQLLEHLIAELAPVREIYVEVEKGNRSGETFYAAKGFKEIGIYQEDLYGHTLTTRKMVLRVAE